MPRAPAPPLGYQRPFEHADEALAAWYGNIIDLGGPQRNEPHECPPAFVRG